MAIKSSLYAKKYSDLHKQIYFNYYMQMVIISSKNKFLLKAHIIIENINESFKFRSSVRRDNEQNIEKMLLLFSAQLKV